MAESSPQPRSFLHRFSAYGDLTLKFQAWGARVCPPYLEPLYIAFYSSILFLIAAPVRNALMANLEALFPERGWLQRFKDAYRVVWNFSFTVADATRARHGENIIDWELDGIEHLEAISESGAILLTAHMGNYDVAAPLFAQKLSRPFNAVRAPERHAETQAWMEEQLATQGNDHYHIRYNKNDRLLGLELAQSIGRGEVVAIQGDRVMFDVALFPLDIQPSERSDDTYRFRLPKGPFVLAQVTGAPIHPVFILRTGWRRYRIKALPAFHCKAQARDREAGVEIAARHWVDDILLPVVREHWTQWFVFESAFEKTEA